MNRRGGMDPRPPVAEAGWRNSCSRLGKRISVSVAGFRLQTAIGWRPMHTPRHGSIGGGGRHHRMSVGSVGRQNGRRPQRFVRLERFVSVVGRWIVSPVNGDVILFHGSIVLASVCLILDDRDYTRTHKTTFWMNWIKKTSIYLVDGRWWLARHFVNGTRSLKDGDDNQHHNTSDDAV